jgi:hypothetical protein
MLIPITIPLEPLCIQYPIDVCPHSVFWNVLNTQSLEYTAWLMAKLCI